MNRQGASNESDGVSETGSTATGPSRHQPNVAYLETASSYKVDMNKLDSIEMRMTGIEEIMSALKLDLESLKPDLESLKKDLKELKQGMYAILRVYGIDPITLQPMGSLATPAENTISTTGPTP